jgi:hypothetical protein
VSQLQEPLDATTGNALTNRETITFDKEEFFCGVVLVMILKVIIKVNLY